MKLHTYWGQFPLSWLSVVQSKNTKQQQTVEFLTQLAYQNFGMKTPDG